MRTLLLLLLPVMGMAQTKPAKDALISLVAVDTLNASDTLIFDFKDSKNNSLDFTGRYEYSFIIQTDSISGANAGTIAVQIANDNDTSPTWFTTSSATIDGAGTQLFSTEAMLRARRLRLFVTSPSGDRVTIVRVYGTAKKLAGPGQLGL